MGKEVVSPLRQRMIEDMNARKLGKHSQRSHIHSCKRFAAFLKRSPETATPDDIRRFQLHLIESGLGICNRNRVMTGVKFLVRVTLRRLDLAAEIYHLREPQKIPQVMSPDETRRLPPHPLLWLPHLSNPRQEYRAYPSAACRAAHSARRHQGGQPQDFDERSARGAQSTSASMPLLRQQHAHHRDLPARAAETQTRANSARDQDRHLMMTEL